MDLTQLRYFQAIAAHESLTAAARALGVSQPTLTVAIRKLESHFSTTLLERNPRGVSLTVTGRALLRHTAEVFDTLDQATEAIQGLEGEEAGSFILGCNESLGAYFLPPFLRSFLSDAPGIEVSLFNASSSDVRQAVISRDVQFGLVVNPLSHPDLVIEPLFWDAVDVFVSAELHPGGEALDPDSPPHPLEGRGFLESIVSEGIEVSEEPRLGVPHAQAGWAETLGEGVIQRLKTGPLIFADSVIQCRQIVEQLNREDLLPGRLLTCGDLELVKSLTLGGVGVGLLPRRVAAYGQAGRLKRLHPGLPIIPDAICLLYRADLHGTRAADRLREALIEYGRGI